MTGETAMGHYTMLAEPATPVIAIDKATAKENAAMMNKEYGNIKVEVWKYSPPCCLRKNGQTGYRSI